MADQLHSFVPMSTVLHCLYITDFLLLKPRDSESNPGLSKSSVINVNDIDTIYLSETFLDSSILVDDKRLTIIFYSIMAADYPSKDKMGGVCLYYKEHLPIIRRDDRSNYKNA